MSRGKEKEIKGSVRYRVRIPDQPHCHEERKMECPLKKKECPL